MKIYDGFVGQDSSNVILDFTGVDSKELYEKNLSTQPKDWYYRETKISYQMNEYGHRSKSVKELNFDNYVLFLGCSNTKGVGLEIEKTFPYLVSKELNCDYYNLAVEGSGIDVQEHNLVTWFYRFNHKPKFVIVQYPDMTRYMAQYPGYDSLLPNGVWSEDDNTKKFIVNSHEVGYLEARAKFCVNTIRQVISVPLVIINFDGIKKYDYGITIKKLDWSRDFIHAGIKSHEKITSNILEQINS